MVADSHDNLNDMEKILHVFHAQMIEIGRKPGIRPYAFGILMLSSAVRFIAGEVATGKADAKDAKQAIVELTGLFDADVEHFKSKPTNQSPFSPN